MHKVKSDSLVWTRTAMRSLPSILLLLAAQRTVQLGNTNFIALRHRRPLLASIATTDAPGADDWTVRSVALPDGADVSTFAAAGNSLYILASGSLYSSADGGSFVDGYPDAAGTASTERMPTILWVQKRSECVDCRTVSFRCIFRTPRRYARERSIRSVGFRFRHVCCAADAFVGGVKADGTLSADTWAFDGANFACLSNKALPKGLKNMSLVSFYTFRTNSIFITKRYSVLMAFGGNDGTANNRKVYISNDYGMTWAEGESLIQLPSKFPPCRTLRPTPTAP